MQKKKKQAGLTDKYRVDNMSLEENKALSSVDNLIEAGRSLLRELSTSELPWIDLKKAEKILRKTSVEDAFHFNREIGHPLWISSDNLVDLCQKIKEINLQAVEYHFHREDFALWIRYLGDNELADQIRNLRKNNLAGEALRKELHSMIEFRCDELRANIRRNSRLK